MANKKVQVQLINGNSAEDVDVLTKADCVKFDDGTTFQSKLDSGILKGEKGDTGERGLKGEKGDTGERGLKGEKGETGETVRVGTQYSTAEQKKLFFKVVG